MFVRDFFSAFASAATVNWSAAINNGLSLADGTNLAVGSLVRVGYFRDSGTGVQLTDAQIQALANSPAVLDNSFVEAGATTIGSGVGGVAGHFNAATQQGCSSRRSRQREWDCGVAQLTAASGSGSVASPIVITEYTDEGEDQFEIQNISNATVNTTGWFVRIGDTQTNSVAGMNTLNATTFTLPASMTAGQNHPRHRNVREREWHQHSLVRRDDRLEQRSGKWTRLVDAPRLDERDQRFLRRRMGCHHARIVQRHD